ncbi:hypothetical protein K435DRAFT_811433 [Dendrothele bispora CBS 962.96]|uniref:Uncharacterized protein n=1 Tax=Dendrothele bispora (strain CBS 962.96) TaxID=1314807 RepID=A0A4V4HBA2_DENBC|nr:hypothetical protein K435DRAFT_811433 [Dendrothele bispora CBS 962.96]
MSNAPNLCPVPLKNTSGGAEAKKLEKSLEKEEKRSGYFQKSAEKLRKKSTYWKDKAMGLDKDKEGLQMEAQEKEKELEKSIQEMKRARMEGDEAKRLALGLKERIQGYQTQIRALNAKIKRIPN